jgi:hypothetical protein
LLALGVVAQQILAQPVAELLVQGAGAFAAQVAAGGFGFDGQNRFQIIVDAGEDISYCIEIIQAHWVNRV